MTDASDGDDLSTETEPSIDAEPTVEADLAVIEAVATELEAVEHELAVMDQDRDAGPAPPP